MNRKGKHQGGGMKIVLSISMAHVELRPEKDDISGDIRWHFLAIGSFWQFMILFWQFFFAIMKYLSSQAKFPSTSFLSGK
jgi:hypothetical protein